MDAKRQFGLVLPSVVVTDFVSNRCFHRKRRIRIQNARAGVYICAKQDSANLCAFLLSHNEPSTARWIVLERDGLVEPDKRLGNTPDLSLGQWGRGTTDK